MPRILTLILAITFTPLALLASDYELRITYDVSSKKMRHGMMKHFAGTYEFSNRSDFKIAESAHEELVDRLNTFDRELLTDKDGTEQQQYDRFLARLALCREAAKVLDIALSKGKKN
jgi:hypothetical protein